MGVWAEVCSVCCASRPLCVLGSSENMGIYTLPVWGIMNEADKHELREGLERIDGIEKPIIRIFGRDTEALTDDPETYWTNVSVTMRGEGPGWLEFKAAIEQVDAGRGKFVIDSSANPLFTNPLCKNPRPVGEAPPVVAK